MKISVKRSFLASALVFSMAFGAVSCSDSSSSSSSTEQTASQQGEWPRTITTDDGELKLDAQPKRIVSTSVTLTGSLLAIGAPVLASGATGANVPELSDEVGFFSQWSDEAKKADVKKLWDNASPEIENIVNYDPDLIVVSKTSGDSVFDQVEEIRKIAPTIVIDYSGASWQDVTKKLGEATGHEAEAEAVISDFEKQVAEAKKQIKLPEGSVSPLMVFPNGNGAAALTREAPQVQLLEELGFTIADVPEEVKGQITMGKRSDIIELSNENIAKGLPGDNWIAVAADPNARKVVKESAAFNTTKQVKEGKVFYTPGETFRFDYYSAQIFLKSIVDQFKA